MFQVTYTREGACCGPGHQEVKVTSRKGERKEMWSGRWPGHAMPRHANCFFFFIDIVWIVSTFIEHMETMDGF